MRAPDHRRQVILFLAAILAPCLLLAVLGLRMAGQERELAAKRRADEHRLAVERIRQQLEARLGRLTLEETSRRAGEPRNAAVAFAGWLRDGKLSMPWEAEGVPESPRNPVFEAALREGERREFVEGRVAAALEPYERALQAAVGPAQRARARLVRARALEGTGRGAAAVKEFRLLLAAPPGIRDEEGVPVRLYAAERLAGSPPDRAAARDVARQTLEGGAWLSPTACYTLSTVVEKLARAASADAERAAAQVLRAAVAARIRRTSQAVALETDLPRLGLRDGVWTPYGEEPWLVTSAPGPAGQRLVLGVLAAAVFGQVLREPPASGGRLRDVRFLTAREAGGDLLGESLPGLKASFTSTGEGPDSGRLQRRFAYAVVLLVFCAALYGAYLLWRDLRREVRLAELQAQFVASVSHELKTPLTAIRMFAETLQMGRPRDPATQAEYLDTIVSECERLSRLVDDVLLFAKIEQGKKTYRFRPVRLADTVQVAVRTLEYPLAQGGFELRMEVDETVPPVRADHDALEQAVLNLLSNAIKYSGGSHEIEVRVARRGGDAAIMVTDHGIGIPAAEQERIFEKFYRASTPENQHIPGTGLGLSLVAQIARAHGGRVEVQSAPGEGSTFTLRLPAVESAAWGATP